MRAIHQRPSTPARLTTFPLAPAPTLSAPRAASIVAVTPAVLWALDRVTFRTILLDHTSSKRKMYETFLASIPILSGLEPYERAKVRRLIYGRARDTAALLALTLCLSP